MTPVPNLAPLLEGFFTQRLIAQRRASPHTIASYRDTFRLLLGFVQKRLGRAPSKLALADLNAPLVASFLEELEHRRTNNACSRNVRLAAVRSFFRYASLEVPEHSALIQRVLAIPRKRHTRPLIDFLVRAEIEALISAPDRKTWIGQRDHAFLLVAVQTGLRLSELTGLRQQDVSLGTGAHVRCLGKGRKQRATPLTKPAAAVVTAWIKQQSEADDLFLFPSARGGRLSADAVQHMVARHVETAQKACPSLSKKRVTPHVLRHTAAMELLQAGVDRALIAIWLGHESMESTEPYLHANLALKEEILAKTRAVSTPAGRFHPGDKLLNFLKDL
jgi:integrase/recombinase XerD